MSYPNYREPSGYSREANGELRKIIVKPFSRRDEIRRGLRKRFITEDQ